MTGELELVYFPLKGRAQPVRLVLTIGGIPFKDTRITYQEYGAMIASGELPLETLPILKKDGRLVASQSGAILRYAAKLAGLDLKSPNEVVRGEDVAGTCVDIAALWSKWFKCDASDKTLYATELVEQGFPFYAKRMETVLLESTHGGPFVTESLSFVDILVYCVCGYISDVAAAHNLADPVRKFSRLAALVDAVAEVPAVKNYDQ